MAMKRALNLAYFINSFTHTPSCSVQWPASHTLRRNVDRSSVCALKIASSRSFTLQWTASDHWAVSHWHCLLVQWHSTDSAAQEVSISSRDTFFSIKVSRLHKLSWASSPSLSQLAAAKWQMRTDSDRAVKLQLLVLFYTHSKMITMKWPQSYMVCFNVKFIPTLKVSTMSLSIECDDKATCLRNDCMLCVHFPLFPILTMPIIISSL